MSLDLRFFDDDFALGAGDRFRAASRRGHEPQLRMTDFRVIVQELAIFHVLGNYPELIVADLIYFLAISGPLTHGMGRRRSYPRDSADR